MAKVKVESLESQNELLIKKTQKHKKKLQQLTKKIQLLQ
jgi:hypothetical protein